MKILDSIIDLKLDDIFLLLDYGIVGFGVLLAILMYNLLRKAQNINNPNTKLNNIIRFFFVTSILLFLLGIYIQVFDYKKEPGVSIETDPADPRLWEEPISHLNLFNSHYYLETNDLYETFKDKLKEGVKFRLLCFSGNDKQNIMASKKKFEKMRSFIKRINQETPLNERKFEVRMIHNQKMPGISFYNSKKDEKDITVYYLDLVVNSNGSPLYGFVVSHEKVVKNFETDFLEYWEIAKEIPLRQILNDEYSVDLFYMDSSQTYL